MVDFVGKNRDSVNEEQVAILKGSKFDLVASLFKPKAEEKPKSSAPARPGARSKSLKKTVGRQFSESLKKLMDKLNSRKWIMNLPENMWDIAILIDVVQYILDIDKGAKFFIDCSF